MDWRNFSTSSGLIVEKRRIKEGALARVWLGAAAGRDAGRGWEEGNWRFRRFWEMGPA